MRRNQKRKAPNWVVGLVLSVLAVIGVALAFNSEIPFRSHFTVKAVMPSANLIKKNSPVRIAGVNVGKVVDVKGMGDGSSAAEITMRIEKQGLPLHDDATITIRPRIFLEGNFFVDLAPGSPSAPTVSKNHTFPIQQGKAPVQIDQVLTALQSDTRTSLQKLLNTLAVATDGQDGGGAAYSRSVKYFKPAYRDSAIVNDATLGLAEHDLSGYVKQAGAAAAALNKNPAELQDLITYLNRTAGAFAVKDDQLRATLTELPRTLSAALPAFSSLNRAFPPTRRFIKDFRPAVRSSLPAINASLPFIRQLRGLVSAEEGKGLARDLRPTVKSLAGLNNVTPPLLREGRPLASCTNTVILPWSKDTIKDDVFPASGPVFEDSVKALPGLAGESRAGDANGQWFSVLANAGNYSSPNGNGGVMLTSQPIMGVNPVAPKTRPPLRPNVACETQQQPDLRSTPAAGPQQTRAKVPAASQAAYLTYQAKAMTWLKLNLDANVKTKGVKVLSPNMTATEVEAAAAKIRATERKRLAKLADDK